MRLNLNLRVVSAVVGGLLLAVGVAVAGATVFFGAGEVTEPADTGQVASVVQDADGNIVISNREKLGFGLSFPLPQNCEEVKVELRGFFGRFESRSVLDEEQTTEFLILDRVAQDLCSYRDYRDVLLAEIQPWSLGNGSSADDSASDADAES